MHKITGHAQIAWDLESRSRITLHFCAKAVKTKQTNKTNNLYFPNYFSFVQEVTTWEKWSFEEDARPAMPLTSNNDESFPMGLAINFNSTRPFVKGEQKLPPAPILMILSTDGVLVPFYVLNQTPSTKHDIVKPPEPLPLGGQRKPLGYGLQSGGTTLQATKGKSKSAYGKQMHDMRKKINPFTPRSAIIYGTALQHANFYNFHLWCLEVCSLGKKNGENILEAFWPGNFVFLVELAKFAGCWLLCATHIYSRYNLMSILFEHAVSFHQLPHQLFLAA